MKTHKILYIFILLLLTANNSAQTSFTSDSLKEILQNISLGQERYDWLKRASDSCPDTPQEEFLLKEMIKTAREMKNKNYECMAWKNLSRNYYNRNDSIGKLQYCLKNIQNLADTTQYYRIAISDVESFICFRKISNKEYETALDAAKEIFKRATENNDTYAYVTSYEVMGNVFSETGQHKEAIQAFQNAFNLIKGDEQYVGYCAQLLTDIASSALEAEEYEIAEETLRELDSYIAEHNKNGDYIFADYNLWLMEVFYVQMYALQNKPQAAAEHLKKAETYQKSVKQNIYAQFRHCYSAALYYRLIGNNRKALECMKGTPYTSTDFLELKAKLLTAEGRYKEAIQTLEENTTAMHLQYDDSFARQINELRAKHEVYRLQLETKEAQLANTNLQLAIISWSLIVLLIIATILAYLFFQLRISKKKVDRANQIKSRFMQNMNHEMRTPLNAIVGFTSVMAEDEEMNPENKEMIKLIQSNAELLLQLVSDTLEATMLESETTEPECSLQDLVPICEKALTNVAPYVHSGVELIFSPQKASCLIYTHQKRLEQLLFKLLVNSTKFTENGRIELAFHLVEEKKIVRITITDTGCGIPPEKQEEVFKNFVKLNDFVQGTGLGLPICRQIAKSLKGKIYIDSTYTDGVKMVIDHPC